MSPLGVLHQNCDFYIFVNLAKPTYKELYWSPVILGWIRDVYSGWFKY